MVNTLCPAANVMWSLSRMLENQPVQTYLCTITAFDSISRLIAKQSGVKPQFNLRKNGTLKLTDIGGYRMPKVSPPDISDIYGAVVTQLDSQIKHALILHESVEMCANRTPTFHNRVVKSDRRGQLLNGLIDISRTLDSRYPIWCPISIPWYEAYQHGEDTDRLRDDLMLQIINILDTLRTNILYDDGTNSQECGDHLIHSLQPLLDIIINGLTLSE